MELLVVVLRPLRSITRGPRTVIEKRKSFIRLGDIQGFQGASIKSLHPLHQPGLLHTESLTPAGLSLEGTEVFLCPCCSTCTMRCSFKHRCSEVRFKMSPLKEILKSRGFEKEDVLFRQNCGSCWYTAAGKINGMMSYPHLSHPTLAQAKHWACFTSSCQN